jgi:hypothetical protein
VSSCFALAAVLALCVQAAADQFSVREQVPGFVADVASGLSGRLGVEGDVDQSHHLFER